VTPQEAGIHAFSVSHVNKYILHPGLWGAKYLDGRDGIVTPKMMRGNAVEKGYIDGLVRGVDFPAALQTAHDDYLLRVENSGGETETTRRAAILIEPMLEQCFKWEAPGPLMAHQIRIETWLDGVSLPFVGYVDLAFEKVDVDLKTTEAIPREGPKGTDIRQVALYRAARNRPGALLYVSKNDHKYYEVTNAQMREGLEELRQAARKIEALLAAFDTPEQLMNVLPIDYSHWAAPPKDMKPAEVFEVIDDL
jgi:hypothetical protein